MDPLSIITSLATTVISRVFPDKTQAQIHQFTLELTKELNQTDIIKKQLDLDAEQVKANAVQAASNKLFISGARPFIMWGLGIILVLFFTASSVLSILVAFKFNVTPMPPMDPLMRDIVLGLLGLGYLTRSYDKKQDKR
jgi:hypothetical protein